MKAVILKSDLSKEGLVELAGAKTAEADTKILLSYQKDFLRWLNGAQEQSDNTPREIKRKTLYQEIEERRQAKFDNPLSKK